MFGFHYSIWALVAVFFIIVGMVDAGRQDLLAQKTSQSIVFQAKILSGTVTLWELDKGQI